MTKAGRNHGFSARIVALKSPKNHPPPVVPAGGGTTRAHRVAKHTPYIHRDNILHELDSLWNAYASGVRRVAVNLSMYNGSVQDRDHDRS
jgi:hypothetical protein